MTRSELEKLLLAESSIVDWKAKGDPEKIVKTLAAYANDYEEAGGGSVLCGVEEVQSAEGSTRSFVKGLSPAAAQRLKDRIFQLSRQLVDPPIAPQFETVAIEDGQQVLIVWITATSDVHAFKNEIFVRLGDKVVRAAGNQIAELSLRKAHLDWLAQPCPGATLEHLDMFALEELAKRLNIPGGPSDLLKPGVRVIGSSLPLVGYIETPTGRQVVPARFAMLLIGSEPHRFMPGAYVSLTKFTGTNRASEVFFPNDLFGPIPYLVKQVMGVLEAEASFVTDKSRDLQSGEQNKRRYSKQALQEILVNALAHRDYQSHLSTKVSIFSDRIEFENPGGAPAGVSLVELKQGVTRWRNPSLARYLFELSFAQERGTGIPKAVQATIALTGSEPKFLTDTWFKVAIPAYQPPTHNEEGPVTPDSGVLIVSIGYGGIDPALIRRSNQALSELSPDRIRTFNHASVLGPDDWRAVVLDLRDWLRGCLENADFKEFHLFYRGPVALAPLIGALAVSRKPVAVYYFDEEESLYRFAYRIDRKLIQAQ